MNLIRMLPKVDIIVINWNSGDQTMAAVKPYLNCQSLLLDCKIIIVDNASTDKSPDLFNGRIDNIIYNTVNVGFGKACNQAFARSNADYILLLNPDTVSELSVLEALVKFLENHQDYAVVGPQQHDKDGRVLKTCCRFPNFKRSFFELLGLNKLFPGIFKPCLIMTDWDHLQSKDVDHVMGSYMLIRKSVINEVGFMDDEYFMYLEDVDLSKRISNAGYKSYFLSDVSIFHEGGGSGGKFASMRLSYSLTSRRIYWKKHFGKVQSFILVCVSLVIEPILRVVDSLIKEKKLGVKKIGTAYYLYVKKMFRA
jgi:N-acetylglucosaminyl-diphospho-decaprenol L-rhamnosyltransferase